MSYMYKSPTGMSWDEFDDEPMDVPSKVYEAAAEPSRPPTPAGSDMQDSASGEEAEYEYSEYLTPAVAEMAEESGMRPTYAFAVQQMWDKCLGRPAYVEFQSCSEEIHPESRLNYSANWLHCKAEQGVDMKVPLQFRPSRLAFSKTWTTGSQGDCIVENDGNAEQHNTHESIGLGISTEEQADQVDQGNAASATADTSNIDEECTNYSINLSPVAFRSLKSDLGSENIFDSASSGDEYDELDSELDSEEEDSDEKSDDDNQGALASPISSATSDHGDVDEAELDEHAASTSPIKDEDYCEVLDFTFPKTDQSTALIETAVLTISPISDPTNAHAAFSDSLKEPVGSESANHDLTAAVDPFDISTDTGFVLADTHRCGVSSEEVQVVTLSSTAPVEVDPIHSAVSGDVALNNYASYNQSERHKEEGMAEFEDAESLFMDIDHNTGPVQDDDVFSPSTESPPSSEQVDCTQSERCNEGSRAVTKDHTPIVEEPSPTPISVGDIIPSVDASTPVSIDLVDYSETKRNAEDTMVFDHTTSFANTTREIRKADITAAPAMGSLNPGSALHSRLCRTHTYTSAIMNKFATGYFAVSSLPWARIGATAVGMGIMYSVTTRMLRR